MKYHQQICAHTPVMFVRRPPRTRRVPVKRHRHLLLLLRGRRRAQPGTPVPGAGLRAGQGDVCGAEQARRRHLGPLLLTPEVIDGGRRRGQGELRPSH